MAKLLRRWIPSPGVLGSKRLISSKVDSAFHLSEVHEMSNLWKRDILQGDYHKSSETLNLFFVYQQNL